MTGQAAPSRWDNPGQQQGAASSDVAGLQPSGCDPTSDAPHSHATIHPSGMGRPEMHASVMDIEGVTGSGAPLGGYKAAQPIQEARSSTGAAGMGTRVAPYSPPSISDRSISKRTGAE
jgi:hypothetical protein